MICPHCKIGITIELYGGGSYPSSDKPCGEIDDEDVYKGYGVAHTWCPECDEFIVLYREGVVVEGSSSSSTYYFKGETNDTVIFPLNSSRSISADEVPEQYKSQFNEAAAVMSLSPMASAAISRRTLQHILRSEFKIKKKSLAEEIEEFIHIKGVPSYLSETVDAVRNIGNFAAHPSKNTNTGEIVEVEPGEADWLLEVLESLFDFVFIQPKRLEARQERLNQKLAELGKPAMKKPKKT